MNLGIIRRQIAHIETRLLTHCADRTLIIPKGSGMRGLREAIARTKEARGDAKWEPPAGEPQSPFWRLREVILKEQAWRAVMGPDIYRDCEAIYDTEDETCMGPTAPNSNPSPE